MLMINEWPFPDGSLFLETGLMPNDLTNFLNTSTRFTAPTRRLIAGSSPASPMLWTISGMVLASCGGGGGGGGGGGRRGPVLTGDVQYYLNAQGNAESSIGESTEPLRFNSIREWLAFDDEVTRDLQSSLGAFREANADGSDPRRASLIFEHAEYGDVTVTYQLTGVDRMRFQFVQEGDDVRPVAVAAFDYEFPSDSDQNRTYEYSELYSWTIPGRRSDSLTLDYILNIQNLPEPGEGPTVMDGEIVLFAKTVEGGNVASVNETNDTIRVQSFKEKVLEDDLPRVTFFIGDMVTDHLSRVTIRFLPEDSNTFTDIVFRTELSGPDADKFKYIQDDGGDARIVTVSGLDYENPLDHNRDNIYEFTETWSTMDARVGDTPLQLYSGSSRFLLHVLDVPGPSDPLTHVVPMIDVYENHPVYQPLDIPSLVLNNFQLNQEYRDNRFFRIDGDGDVRWIAAPDFEDPQDGGGDNVYEIELTRVDSGGAMHRVMTSVRVMDIDPGSTQDPRELDTEILTSFGPRNIPDANKPSTFAQNLVWGYSWKLPETGPVIITYAISEGERNELLRIFSGNQEWADEFYALLEAKLDEIESAANVKFVEVDHGQRETLEIFSGVIAPTVPYYVLEFQNTEERSHASITSDGGEVVLWSEHVLKYPGYVVLHEFGHALGLHHPFEDTSDDEEEGEVDDYDPQVHWPGLEAFRYNPESVLSYNFGTTTLRTADIETLRFLYGYANTNSMGVERFITNVEFPPSPGDDDGDTYSEAASRLEFIKSDELWTMAATAPDSIGSAIADLGVTYVRAEVDPDNPHRAIWELSFNGQRTPLMYTQDLHGPDFDRFKFIQDGDDVRIVTTAAPDFDRPADADGDNSYEYFDTFNTNDRRIIRPGLQRFTTQFQLVITDIASDNQTAQGLYLDLHPDNAAGRIYSGYKHLGGDGILPEYADGSSAGIDLGYLSDASIGPVSRTTLRLKTTGSNDNNKFTLNSDGRLLYIGTGEDFENDDSLSIEVEFIAASQVSKTETYVIHVSDVDFVPVTATPASTGSETEFVASVAESDDAIIIENISYVGADVAVISDQRTMTAGGIVELSGPDSGQFKFTLIDGAVRIVSKTGFDYEIPADTSADGMNTYKITLDPASGPDINYTITITNVTTNDPQPAQSIGEASVNPDMGGIASMDLAFDHTRDDDDPVSYDVM